MKNVLVVVTRQIGDVLLSTALIHQLRERWPGAAVDVLGLKGTLGMLSGNADVRECIVTDPNATPRDTLKLARRLWRRYDLALIADPGDRAHIIGFIAARERAGLLPAESGSNWWKRRLLSHVVITSGDLGNEHVVTERLRLLAPWQVGGHAVPLRSGAAHAPSAPSFQAPASIASTQHANDGVKGAQPKLVAPASAPLPAELTARLRPRYVVVHTPSMWPYKQWPLSHFRDLIARLAAAGQQVVLTGGPGSGDREAVQAMKGAASDELLIDAGVLDFNQLAGLLRGAALYIGPDTSVSHLAAACDTPVLAIFGPTNPQRWAPWPATTASFERRSSSQTLGKITIVQSSLPCVPCGKAGCEDHRQSRSDCLQDIAPERVATEALALLARGHPSTSSGQTG